VAKKKKPAQRNTAADEVDFESAIKNLEQIVGDLEGGQLGLNESLTRYEEGVSHLKRCFELLARAERRIAILTGVDADGNPVTEAFDDEHEDLDQKAAARSKRRTAAKPANKRPPNVVDDSGGLF
jgi:exodeoxyribonuclease VII small subunit